MDSEDDSYFKNDINKSKSETDRMIPDYSQDTTNKINKEPVYALYKWRWVIVIFFCTSVTASGVGMMGFSPITTIIQELYGITDFEAQLLMMVFVILYIPLMFPANYLIENKGICIPIYIASVTMILGAWIRMLVNVNYNFVLVGQIFMAIGQPFMLTGPAKVAGLWFSENEQALATTLGSLAQPIGAMIGFLIPLPFVKDSDKHAADGKDKFQFYILVQSIIITVLGLPIVFCARNKPPTPPSKSAEEMDNMVIESQISSLCKLIKDRNFIMILFAFSFIFSVYVTLGASVSQLSDRFGFDSKDNSIFGTVFIVAGLVGSFAHAIPLDIYQYYKYQYIVIGFLCILSTVAMTGGFHSGKLSIACLAIGFLGAAQLPIIGVSYSFAAESTFPINEAHSCGFLQLIGSI